jgi:hypothetical protein
MTSQPTRRALFAGAVAARSTTGSVVANAIDLEQLAAFSCETVIASGLLRHRARSLVQRVRSDELAHQRALQRFTRQPAPGPLNAQSADQGLSRHGIHRDLRHLRTEHDCIALLLDLESVAEGTYFDAISRLADGRLLVLAAEIMASEAQHFAALTEVLHPGDVSRAAPDPFVKGRP